MINEVLGNDQSPNIKVSHFFENDTVGIAIEVAKENKAEIIKIIAVKDLSNKPLPANGFDSISFKSSVNGGKFLPFSFEEINKIIGTEIVSSVPFLPQKPNQKTLLIKLSNKNHILCVNDDGDYNTYAGEALGVGLEFLREGKGIFSVPDGERYEGEFKDDNFNGDGVYHFVKGDRYEGEFKDEKKHGTGAFYFVNGNRYEGEFKNNNFNGKGVYYFANGNRYEGDWKCDKKDGKGVYHFVNGDHFKGTWKDDSFITNKDSQKDKNLIIIRPVKMNTSPIIPVYDVTTINEDTTDDDITNIIQNSIEKNNGKLRIAINTHGNKEGVLLGEESIKKTLGFITDRVSQNRAVNGDETVNKVKKIDLKIDLRLYNCYGGAFVRKNQEWLSQTVEETDIPWKITFGPSDRPLSSFVHNGKMFASSAHVNDTNSVVLHKAILYPNKYIFSEEERSDNTKKGYKLLNAKDTKESFGEAWTKVETTEKLQDFVDGKAPKKPELPTPPGTIPVNTNAINIVCPFENLVRRT